MGLRLGAFKNFLFFGSRSVGSGRQVLMNTSRNEGERKTTPIGCWDDAFHHSYHKVARRSLASFFCVSTSITEKRVQRPFSWLLRFESLRRVFLCVLVSFRSTRKSFTRRFAILVHFLSSVLMIVQLVTNQSKSNTAETRRKNDTTVWLSLDFIENIQIL